MTLQYPAPEFHAPSVLFEEPLSRFRRERVIPLILHGAAASSFVLGAAYITWWLVTTPTAPVWMRAIPVFIVGLLLHLLLSSGPAYFRSRFAVFKNGFRPSFKRPSIFSPELPSFIPFREVIRIRVKPYNTDPNQIYSVSVELMSGSRLVIEESDVGPQGLKALLEAFSVAGEAMAPEVETSRPFPLWIRREWKSEAAAGLIYLVTFGLALALIVLPPMAMSSALLLVVAILSMGIAWGAWSLARAWSVYQEFTAERIHGTRGDRP
jgi:hypothetical protein